MDQTEYAAPYVDLQVNGFVGIDFNDPETSSSKIEEALASLESEGTALCLPTVITAAPDSMEQCISNLARVCQLRQPTALGGIHIEGPFLSPEPGYIGAHPTEHACSADRALLERLLKAGQGHVRLITLAPEMDPQGELTRLCRSQGIQVAAGHTDATLDQLNTCIQAGLGLFTHLGNGCPRLLDRHDNIIYRALHFRDRLHYSLIADGFHVPELLFRHLLSVIPQERVLIVSDSISAAGLGPGIYPLGHREVEVRQDGAAWDPEGQHFVGSASSMRDADRWLTSTLGLPLDARHALLSENSKRFLTLD